jgi:hypothetical protein
VVQQHPVTGAYRGSHVAQRSVAYAARGELLDEGIEQFATPR